MVDEFPAQCYERAEPGALLHQDTKRLQRFDTPGHWATGQRSEIPPFRS
jgi:hypothetical protein